MISGGKPGDVRDHGSPRGEGVVKSGMPVRYLKAALVGLVGGLLLAASVLTVEIIHAQRVVASQMANCADDGSRQIAYVCGGAVQLGGVVELSVAFALGFAAVFAWYLRRSHPVTGR